jgi:type IX secretion system PorP/SprF family membrane protein
MEGENPRGEQYWDTYTAAQPHHGIGLKIINDKTGPLNRFSAFASYAYHVGIGLKTSLAAGFDIGMQNLSLQSDKLVFDPSSPGAVDPAVGTSGIINKIKPDLNAGLYLYSSDYFIGLAAQQIIPQKIYFANDQLVKSPSKNVPHLFASAGYRFFLDEDISALPSVMVKYVAPLPVQFDMNAKLQYRDLLWIGGGYRQSDGFTAMLGLNVSHTFNISYSYDHTTSGLNTVSRGTHEFVLGFLLNNKFGDWCPRNVW